MIYTCRTEQQFIDDAYEIMWPTINKYANYTCLRGENIVIDDITGNCFMLKNPFTGDCFDYEELIRCIEGQSLLSNEEYVTFSADTI